MFGETSSQTPAWVDSKASAELGMLSRTVVEVIQLDAPAVIAVVQPAGSTGAERLSKFWVIVICGTPSCLLKLNVPRLAGLSWSCSVGLIVWPQAPLAMKVNVRF